MEDRPMYSSFDLLRQIPSATDNPALTPELLGVFDREMRERMDAFDIEQQKTVKAIQDLIKQVITA